MKFKGQGKINICGVEYKKNIADSRRGGGGVRAPKKNPCIRAWGVSLITFAGALLAHDDGWKIVSKMVRAVPLLQGRIGMGGLPPPPPKKKNLCKKDKGRKKHPTDKKGYPFQTHPLYTEAPPPPF